MWRKMIDGMLGKPAEISTESNSSASPSSMRPTRQTIMYMAYEFVAKSNLDGCYAEFGCFQGDSMIRAYEAYQYWLARANEKKWSLGQHPMFVFDSFAGLPELTGDDQLTDYGVFEEGQYACSEANVRQRLADAGVDLSIVKTVPGFYEDSLTPTLKSELDFPKPAIVHIDCDLRSSASTVLHWLTDSVQDGALFLFDDYFCFRGNPQHGVRRAFEDWLKETGFVATHYLNYSWAGSAFIINKLDA